MIYQKIRARIVTLKRALRALDKEHEDYEANVVDLSIRINELETLLNTLKK